MPLILGLLALTAIYLAVRLLAQADPRWLAMSMRRTGGVGLLSLAGFLALRGALVPAIPLFMLGASMLGFRQSPFSFPFGGGPFGGAERSAGRNSRVRTATLEMELDHDTGAMDGVVLSGNFAGKRLSELPDASLDTLMQEVEVADHQCVRLLEAYLERRPGWQGRKREGDGRRSRRDSGMARAEALEVLGLKAGAGVEEIRQAHRALMKKLHPDQGGSTYFAARLNEAKDVLLRG